MNKFQKAENKGREIFRRILEKSDKVVDYHFSDDDYSNWDCIYDDDKGHLNVIELKYREGYSSTDRLIQEEGAIIEKFKFDSLRSYCPNDNHFYVMMFNDGVGYLWNLDKLEPDWIIKPCPRTSAIKGKTINKIVANLPLESGYRFTFSEC